MSLHLLYYDEAGCDGWPKRQTDLFVLSGIYFNYLNWHALYDKIKDYRKGLKTDFGLNSKLELHMRQIIRGKEPYRSLKLSPQAKLDMLRRTYKLCGELEWSIINVVIDKSKIRKRDFDVLQWALTLSIQRVENTLNSVGNEESKFLMITDEGRLSKMRRISRKIQVINHIPHKPSFGDGTRSLPIKRLVEDPLPKDSKNSYFVQFADAISFLVYTHVAYQNGAQLASRTKRLITQNRVLEYLTLIKPKLILAADPTDPFGIKVFPK